MIQWPYPFPGPLPVPVPQPGPGGGVTDVPGGDINVSDPAAAVDTVGVDSSTVVGTVGSIGVTPAPSSSSSAGPAQAGDWKQFLIWLAALAALWLILTAMQDAGYPQVANGLAGLILFGAILAMGPKAIGNAKLIFQ